MRVRPKFGTNKKILKAMLSGFFAKATKKIFFESYH